MNRKKFRIGIMTAILSAGITLSMSAQIGGQSTYGLLNLNSSARSGALGGSLISGLEPDVSMMDLNPAYLQPALHNQLSLNYVNYFADINYGRVGYAYDTGKAGVFGASLFYLNYGQFIEANEYGEITGEFQAAEYSFDINWAYQFDSTLTVGVSLSPVYSEFERYSSWGIAADAGILYLSPGKLTSAAITLRNLGTQLSTYYSPEKEPLPFEILAGVSQKIKHAPFRLNLTIMNLQQFDLDVALPDDETDPATGDKIYQNKFIEISSKSLDHVVAGVEFVPGKVLSLRFGYNFRNRAEMKLGTRNTATGLSFGVGLNMGKIRIDYGLASYHVAGMSHLITLSGDLNGFK